MPPLPTRKTNPRGPYQRPQGQESHLRVRQIQGNLLEEQEDQDDQNEIESVDPESALFMKEGGLGRCEPHSSILFQKSKEY